MIARKCVIESLENNREKLTKQQKKTINGQLNAGDGCGAYKGLNKILDRIEESKEDAI